jgi:DNA-binding transcriptional MerR regulator
MDNIDQKSKSRTATGPTINQQKGNENLGLGKEEGEQQGKVSMRKEEKGFEEERAEGTQTTSKNQRGKYRQYEDSQVIIERIRTYRTQRYPDSEIMKLLDNMPRRTYYNYVKKLQEQERQIIEQWTSENIEHFAEELMIYREALCQKLREVQGIIDNKNTAPKDKMQAIEQYLAISEKLVKFERSGRIDDIKYAKYNSYSPY